MKKSVTRELLITLAMLAIALIIALLVAPYAAAQSQPKSLQLDTTKPQLGTFSTVDRTLDTTRSLWIAAGKGSISIDGKTGKVNLDNVELDEASKRFWDSVSASFPLFANAVIAGYKAKHEQDRLRDVKWFVPFMVDGKPGKMGLRTDGVLVWKEDVP